MADACLSTLWDFLYTLAVQVNSSGEGKKLRLLHVYWTILLQSTGNSVSKDNWFVMFRCLVSEPFNTKLSMRCWGWRLLEQTMVFWHKIKIVFRRTGMALIVFCMALLQSTYNSASNGIWFVMFRYSVSDPFDTKLFTKYGSVSVATAYAMSNEHPANSDKQARATLR